MKANSPITFVTVTKPDKELVTFLYKNFSFSEESMISDFSKLYIKASKGKRLRFDIVFAICRGRIVGWGTISTNLAHSRKQYGYRDMFKHGKFLIMLYVNNRCRGLGIASNLFSILLKQSSKSPIIVIGHDKASFSFFSLMKKLHKRKINIIDWR